MQLTGAMQNPRNPIPVSGSSTKLLEPRTAALCSAVMWLYPLIDAAKADR